METETKPRSASRTSSIGSAASSRSSSSPKSTGTSKAPSRKPSSASLAQSRPALARATSSTASLTNAAMLNRERFGGWDSHMYSRKIEVLCQMLPGTEIIEERHRHAHVDMRSYRITVPFGMLVVDQQHRLAYKLGGLTQCGLFDEALNDLKLGSRCVGAALNMTGGVDESGKDRERVINCIYWGAPTTAEKEPAEISEYFGCSSEVAPVIREAWNSPSDAITIRLKLLEGYERDSQFEPLEAAKGKGYLYKAQYRLTASSKTLGDLSVPLIQRKAILLQALPHCKFNEEIRESGALFSGKANISNGVLGLVAWSNGTWQPITKSRSGF